VRSRELLDARANGNEVLVLELASESAAGHPSADLLGPGTCMRIATGAVVPTGADAVVAQEDTRRISPSQIELSSTALAQIAPGRWIRPIGSDVRDEELLLEPGVLLGGGEASLLAGAGHAEVAVRRRPIVAILGSGDELVAIGQSPGRGQIVSTNTMMLAAQIREAGGEPLELGFVADTEAAVRAAIQQAMMQADLLIGTGGISVGDHDLLLPVLEQLGFEQRFRKIALRPGRPTTFGRLPRGPERGSLGVLALPGNPAATMVAFELLGRPLLRGLLGLPRHRWQRRPRSVELATAAEGDRLREHFVRAKLDEHGRAHPLDKQLSGALRSIADFDVLVRVPAGRTRVEAGESLPALFIRD
jgi:molybdopterin molybdotransferase